MDGATQSQANDGIADTAAQPRHDFLYWEFHETNQMALRSGDWKLYVDGGVPRLYNLAEDIHEDTDLAASYPDKVKQLVKILCREHCDHPLFPVTLPTCDGQ